MCYLLLHCLDDCWMAVAQHVDGDTCDKVQVGFAVSIPYACSFSAYQGEGVSLECSLVVLMLKCDPIALLYVCCYHV